MSGDLRVVEHEIDPAPTGGADGPKCHERHFAETRAPARGEAAWTDIARLITEIFRLVVVESVGRVDSNQRQYLTIEH